MAKGFVVAAPTSGSGKTLVTLGLLRAFRNAGKIVRSAKVGPDFIDPGFHAAASGAPCFNLDFWAMGEKACHALLSQQAHHADLVFVEGVMGLFDGPQGADGSTADLAGHTHNAQGPELERKRAVIEAALARARARREAAR